MNRTFVNISLWYYSRLHWLLKIWIQSQHYKRTKIFFEFLISHLIIHYATHFEAIFTCYEHRWIVLWFKVFFYDTTLAQVIYEADLPKYQQCSQTEPLFTEFNCNMIVSNIKYWKVMLKYWEYLWIRFWLELFICHITINRAIYWKAVINS